MKNITSIVKNLDEKLAAHFNPQARHVILLYAINNFTYNEALQISSSKQKTLICSAMFARKSVSFH